MKPGGSGETEDIIVGTANVKERSWTWDFPALRSFAGDFNEDAFNGAMRPLSWFGWSVYS